MQRCGNLSWYLKAYSVCWQAKATAQMSLPWHCTLGDQLFAKKPLLRFGNFISAWAAILPHCSCTVHSKYITPRCKRSHIFHIPMWITVACATLRNRMSWGKQTLQWSWVWNHACKARSEFCAATYAPSSKQGHLQPSNPPAYIGTNPFVVFRCRLCGC